MRCSSLEGCAGAPARSGQRARCAPVLELAEDLDQHRHDQQRHECGDDQPADHRQRQRPLQLGARAEPERQRHQPGERADRRHQDGPEPDAAGVGQRLIGRLPGVRRVVRGVEQQNAVLHDEPHQQDHPMKLDTLNGTPLRPA